MIGQGNLEGTREVEERLGTLQINICGSLQKM